MVNYNDFDKETLIKLIHNYVRAIEYYIYAFDLLIDVFHYLDGIEISCPEKEAQRVIAKASHEVLKQLIEVSKEIDKVRSGN